MKDVHKQVSGWYEFKPMYFMRLHC